MEIINWEIVKRDKESNWVVEVNTEEFGWVEIKKNFENFIDAANYIQKYYNGTELKGE